MGLRRFLGRESPREQAERIDREASCRADLGDTEAAERGYREASRVDPTWSVPWYNLGLLHKNLRRWAESRDENARAAALDPANEPAWWNLGIAATALQDWREARRAWKGFGLAIENGSEPPSMHLGIVPIRVRPEENGEVVWCERIDPARAIVRSIPFPESGRSFGDLLLHDGTGTGTRRLGGRELTVFDEIELIEPSHMIAWETRILFVHEQQVHDLAKLAFDRGLGVEDWSAVQLLCKQCSLGSPDEHAHAEVSWPAEKRIAIAAPAREEAQAILDLWMTSPSPGAMLARLRRATGKEA